MLTPRTPLCGSARRMLSVQCLIRSSYAPDPLRRNHLILVILLGSGFKQMEIKLPLKIREAELNKTITSRP